MTLITSISGIRGTIGGVPGSALTPPDIIRFTSAYGDWLKSRNPGKTCSVVIGRDARISGAMVSSLVASTLCGMGIDVIDAGLSTTPSVEMAVPYHKAQGGIILTASHNPRQWNALKLLNEFGEFVSAADGEAILARAESNQARYAEVDALGHITYDESSIERHIRAILDLPLVDCDAIRTAGFRVVVDAVNSTGGIAVPMLLEALGVSNTIRLYCEPTGEFPHNPEPLPEHLSDLSSEVVINKAHLGLVVDPDVDRLAIVCEDGTMFGEEYTLVSVADYVLSRTPGNTVSNLSSTRALQVIAEKYSMQHTASAVGEVNVVVAMKANQAIIGGEGNGGVILPELHYGRDALVGIALFLSHLARSGKSCKSLRSTYPDYYISKNKLELEPGTDVEALVSAMQSRYKDQPMNNVDGVRIEFGDEWVHLRRSNTEPIIRIYAESASEEKADALAKRIVAELKERIPGIPA
ncbi:MAG: phosphoglucosamine mutase [Bacteroidota bacterium]